MNGYMTTKEAAEKWGIGIRRINTLCNEGRIDGCVRFGSVWAIPADTINLLTKESRVESI